MKRIINYLLGATCIIMMTFTSCKKEELSDSLTSSSPIDEILQRKGGKCNSNTTFYLLAGNQLDKFNSNHSETPVNSATITGLQVQQE